MLPLKPFRLSCYSLCYSLTQKHLNITSQEQQIPVCFSGNVHRPCLLKRNIFLEFLSRVPFFETFSGHIYCSFNEPSECLVFAVLLYPPVITCSSDAFVAHRNLKPHKSPHKNNLLLLYPLLTLDDFPPAGSERIWSAHQALGEVQKGANRSNKSECCWFLLIPSCGPKSRSDSEPKHLELLTQAKSSAAS